MSINPYILSATLSLFAIAPASAQEVSNDAELYNKYCALCHIEGGTGTFMLERRLSDDPAILEQRDNLSKEYIETVVRWGVGSMPRFSRAEITDAELAVIIQHLLSSNTHQGAAQKPAISPGQGIASE